jgi:putative transposase
MAAAVKMAPVVGIVALCAALGLSRATFYRHKRAAAGLATPPQLAPKAASEAVEAPACAPEAVAAVAVEMPPQLAPKAATDGLGARAIAVEPPLALKASTEAVVEAPLQLAPKAATEAVVEAPLQLAPKAVVEAPQQRAPKASTEAVVATPQQLAPKASTEAAAAVDAPAAIVVATPQQLAPKASTKAVEASACAPEALAAVAVETPLQVAPKAIAAAASAATPRKRPRALTTEERNAVLAMLNEPRFQDKAPAEIYATLLDEGVYLCSERTMYRILAAHRQVRERRNQLRHPNYVAPELMAEKPNQLWSWDITKLKTYVKSQYLHLYVLLDVYSRYAVGWMVADHESGELAKTLIDDTCEREGITPGQLTFHADNGPAMISQPVAFLLASLGVTKSHSRPHVSDDNPFSEAQFKTLKYRPDFPERFASVEHARAFLWDFFNWYNNEHHHDSLALLTPHDVHHGLVKERLTKRAAVLSAAYAAHPERFVHRPPTPAAPPEKVWINPPKQSAATQAVQA